MNFDIILPHLSALLVFFLIARHMFKGEKKTPLRCSYWCSCFFILSQWDASTTLHQLQLFLHFESVGRIHNPTPVTAVSSSWVSGTHPQPYTNYSRFFILSQWDASTTLHQLQLFLHFESVGRIHNPTPVTAVSSSWVSGTHPQPYTSYSCFFILSQWDASTTLHQLQLFLHLESVGRINNPTPITAVSSFWVSGTHPQPYTSYSCFFILSQWDASTTLHQLQLFLHLESVGLIHNPSPRWKAHLKFVSDFGIERRVKGK